MFLLALLGGLIFGLIVHRYHLSMFVGPDSGFYDDIGRRISEYWHGLRDLNDPILSEGLSLRGPGWGMNYFVGALYYLFGSQLPACSVVLRSHRCGNRPACLFLL